MFLSLVLLTLTATVNNYTVMRADQSSQPSIQEVKPNLKGEIPFFIGNALNMRVIFRDKVIIRGKGRNARYALEFKEKKRINAKSSAKASAVFPEKSREKVLYKSTYADVNENYTVGKGKVKHTLTINKSTATRYTWELKVRGHLSIFADGNNRTSAFTTTKDIEFKDRMGKVIFKLPVPYIEDSKGKKMDCSYELRPISRNVWNISVVIPRDFFSTAIFPVSLDPTVMSEENTGYEGDTWWGAQRKIVRDKNGVLHAVFYDDYNCWILYTKSEDNGLTWSTPTVLGGQSTWDAYYPSIAVGNNGHIYVAWEDYDNSGDYYGIWFREWDGTRWSATEWLTPNQDAWCSGVAVDGNNRVYVVFEDWNVGQGQIMLMHRDAGGTWSGQSNISNTPFDVDCPSIFVDKSNYVYAAFNSGYNDPDEYEMYVVKNTGSGWSAPEKVSNTSSNKAYEPSVVVDTSGNIYIAWCQYNGSYFDVYMNVYTAGSKGWGTPFNVYPDAGNRMRDPVLGLDGNENVYIVWYGNSPLGNDDIFYRTYSNGSLSPVVNATNLDNGDAYGPSITATATNEPYNGPYLIWAEYDNSTKYYDVKCRYLGPASGTLPAPVLLYPENIGFAPKLARFDWGDIENPADVYYTLQVSTDPTFATVDVVNKPVFNNSEYTLNGSGTEFLGEGVQYYWRAKARTYNGLTSDWSSVYSCTGDTLPPATTPSVNLISGSNGWWTQATLTLTGSDATSGVYRTYIDRLPFDTLLMVNYSFPGTGGLSAWDPPPYNGILTNRAIGFDFPFLGDTFDTLNICTNGWISFTYQGTDMNSGNKSFPMEGMENTIAACWSYWYMGNSSARVYYGKLTNPDRYVIYWYYPYNGWYWTRSYFAVTLYPSGKIDFSYNRLYYSSSHLPLIGLNKGDGITGYEYPVPSYWGDMDYTTLWSFGEYTGQFNLSDGNPTDVYYFSVDNATNQETLCYFSQDSIDGTPPSIVIQDPVNDQNINGTTYTITGTSSDNLSGMDSVIVSFDMGGSWSPATGIAPWTYNWSLPANDTTITIIAQAVDSAGNIGGDTIVVHVYPDMSVSKITSPANGDTGNAPSVTISGTATPSPSGVVDSVWIIVNGTDTLTATLTGSSGGDTTWNASYNFSSLASPYIIQSIAFNGSDAEIPNSGITVYSPPYPTSEIISPEAGAMILNPIIYVSGTATAGFGNIDSVQLSMDNGVTWSTVNGTGDWNYTWYPPDEGIYNLLSRAFNSYDTVSLLLDTNTIYVDLAAPDVAISSPANGDSIDLDVSPSLNITGTASDAVSGVKEVLISADNGARWDTTSGGANWTYQWTPDSAGAYTILAKAVDNAGRSNITSVDVITYSPTGIGFESARFPVAFFLSAPNPNIIRGITEISYGIPRDANTSITIYDISGRQVITLINGNVERGYHKVKWDTSRLTQGIYFIVMETDTGFRDVKKAIIIR